MNKHTLYNFPLFEFTIQLKTTRDGVETSERFDFHQQQHERVFTLRELTSRPMCMCMCMYMSIVRAQTLRTSCVRINNSRSASAIRACLYVSM